MFSKVPKWKLLCKVSSLSLWLISAICIITWLSALLCCTVLSRLSCGRSRGGGSSIEIVDSSLFTAFTQWAVLIAWSYCSGRKLVCLCRMAILSGDIVDRDFGLGFSLTIIVKVFTDGSQSDSLLPRPPTLGCRIIDAADCLCEDSGCFGGLIFEWILSGGELVDSGGFTTIGTPVKKIYVPTHLDIHVSVLIFSTVISNHIPLIPKTAWAKQGSSLHHIEDYMSKTRNWHWRHRDRLQASK